MMSNRRLSLRSSAALAVASTVPLPAVARSAQSPNDRLRVSVIGMRRSLAHALSLARMRKNGENVEIVMDYVHHPNWLKACRSRKQEDLNADVLEGHMACTMPLLGNISYLTARTIDFDPETETIKNDDAEQPCEASRHVGRRLTLREQYNDTS